MMLRIAEAPTRDTQNEGKTLTPYWAADLLGLPVMVLVNLAYGRLSASCAGSVVRNLRVNDYLFEIVDKERQECE